MILTLTDNQFDADPYWHNPVLDEAPLLHVDCVDLFDQNGYHLTKAEQAYAQANKYPRVIRRHELTLRQDWILSDRGNNGVHVNHCDLFQRRGFTGEALTQLQSLAYDNQLLWKLIKMKPKWANAIMMTAAICKAATYVQNVSVQVTLRGTSSAGREEHPVLVNLYDSRKNSLNHVITLLKSVSTFGCTPEGICFDGMMRKSMLVRGSSEVDSYFLNISDGEPAMSNFVGRPAAEYTRRQVEKMRNTLDMSIMSFFASEHSWELSPDSSSNKNFRLMYGKDAAFIKADNMTELARVMNSKYVVINASILNPIQKTFEIASHTILIKLLQ